MLFPILLFGVVGAVRSARLSLNPHLLVSIVHVRMINSNPETEKKEVFKIKNRLKISIDTRQYRIPWPISLLNALCKKTLRRLKWTSNSLPHTPPPPWTKFLENSVDWSLVILTGFASWVSWSVNCNFDGFLVKSDLWWVGINSNGDGETFPCKSNKQTEPYYVYSTTIP